MEFMDLGVEFVVEFVVEIFGFVDEFLEAE